MSSIDNQALTTARRLARVLLDTGGPNEADAVLATLQTAVDTALIQHPGANIDRDALRRELETEFSVFIERPLVLSGDESDHEPWLDRRRGELDWRFWLAYRELMIQRGLSAQVIARLDEITDDVLGRLEEPGRRGPWDRRGMVVGQVQSGKTGNYTALICKAADAGYRVIVVLAGLHNSLRSQTQQRLDEGFLGLDSRTSSAYENTNRALGVGSGNPDHPAVYTFTSSDNKGDFSKAVAGRIAGKVGTDPVLLVVKKHKTILGNLRSWVTQNNGQVDPTTNRRVVRNLPLLIIDDEADNASINTKEVEQEFSADGEITSETDPTAINREIRLLLASFEQSALVAYTATPFANIFIGDHPASPVYGEDLFPRSFILRLPPPSNYIGPAEVFGLPRDDGPDRPGLPILRDVTDSEDWLPTGHKTDAIPGPLPDSLKEATLAFVIVCAARRVRGQTEVHNSMLVHVTRLVLVQGRVVELIRAELDRIKDDLRYDQSPDSALRTQLHGLWRTDFQKTTAAMPEHLRAEPTEWDAVDAELQEAVARIRVLEINGSAKDALEYGDHPDGISVIAIGGNKLSRGLTLEGLSVSYYLRASKMYDTLMQMGRWFGYRPGYTDLCRLYTTPQLQLSYRDISQANEELLDRFKEMADTGGKPEDFALYVRQSAAGMLVTAHSKMRSGISVKLTFSRDISETITFTRNAEHQQRNLDAVEELLKGLGTPSRTRRHNPMWEGVDGRLVAELMTGWVNAPSATKARGTAIATYIRARMKAGALTDWTVALISSSTADTSCTIAGHDIGLTERQRQPAARDLEVVSVRRLASPTDETLDLEQVDIDAARVRTLARHRADPDRRGKPDPRNPSGPDVRGAREPQRGLLLLYPLRIVEPALPGDPPVEVKDPDGRRTADPIDGFDGPVMAFAISFPDDPDAPAVDYRMPRRYADQQESIEL